MSAAAEKASDGRVLVYARVRPPSPEEETAGLAAQCSEQGIRVVGAGHDGVLGPGQCQGQGPGQGQANTKDFSFDGVFDGSSKQSDVFDKVGSPVLQELLRGVNGAILAYGQTGSGKTFSLLHQGRVSSEAGLLYRLVAALFGEVERLSDSLFDIQAAAIQVYNEQVDDLLHPGHDSGQGSGLSVLNGGAIPGLTWKTCSSPEELMRTFDAARANLIYAETKMNKASSRSHAVFQIHLTRRTWAPAAASASSSQGALGSSQRVECRTSRLSIVDLAGSERVKKSGVEGAQFKEATAINRSLLSLGNVVSALAAKKPHVPMRESKLTRILDGSIGGNCRTVLLVCASPSMASAQETLSTFEFASRAMRVEVDARVNCSIVEVDGRALLKDLDREQAAANARRAAALREEASEAESALQGASAEVERTKNELKFATQQCERQNEELEALQAKVYHVNSELKSARMAAHRYEQSVQRSNEELAVGRDMAADAVAEAELLSMELATATREREASGRAEACAEERTSELSAKLGEVSAQEMALETAVVEVRIRSARLEERCEASRAEAEEEHKCQEEAKQELKTLQSALTEARRREEQGEEERKTYEEEVRRLQAAGEEDRKTHEMEARRLQAALQAALQESSEEREEADEARRAAQSEVQALRDQGEERAIEHERSMDEMRIRIEESSQATLNMERAKWKSELAEVEIGSKRKAEELERQSEEAAQVVLAQFKEEMRQQVEAFNEENSTWEVWLKESRTKSEASENEQKIALQALQAKLEAQKVSMREETKAHASLSKELNERMKQLKNRDAEVQELRSAQASLRQSLEKRESEESAASKAAAQQASRLRKAMADLRAAKAEMAEREVELVKLRGQERAPTPQEASDLTAAAALAAERSRWAERAEAQEGEVEDLRRKLQNRDENDRIFGKASHRDQAQRLGHVPSSASPAAASAAAANPESRRPPTLSNGRNGPGNGCRTPASAGATPVAKREVGRSWSARAEHREQRDASPLRAASAEVLRRTPSSGPTKT